MPDQFGGIEVSGTDQFGGIPLDVEFQNRTPQKAGLLDYVKGSLRQLTMPLTDMFQDSPGENVKLYEQADIQSRKLDEAIGRVAPGSRLSDAAYGPATFGVAVPYQGAPIPPMQPPSPDAPLPAAMIAPGRVLKAASEQITPLNIGLALGTGGAGKLASPLLKTLGIIFGTKMAAESLPQIAGDVSVKATPENISDLAINTALLGAIGKGITEKPGGEPSGATPTEDVTSPLPVPPERQLKGPIPLPDALTTPKGTYQGPIPLLQPGATPLLRAGQEVVELPRRPELVQGGLARALLQAQQEPQIQPELRLQGEAPTVTPKRPFSQQQLAQNFPAPGEVGPVQPSLPGPGPEALPSVYQAPSTAKPLRTSAQIAAENERLRQIALQSQQQGERQLAQIAGEPTATPPLQQQPTPPTPSVRPGLPRQAKGVSRVAIDTDQPALSRLLTATETIHRTQGLTAPSQLETVFSNVTRWLRERGRNINEPNIWQDYFAEASDPTSKFFVDQTARRQYLNSVKTAYTKLRRINNPEAELLADADRIGSIKKGPPKQPARPLTKDEQGTLLSYTRDAAEKGGVREKRNYAWVSFMADTATRAGGVANLRMRDIDWQNNRITLYGGSTEANTIQVHPETLARIRTYLESDNRAAQGPNELVFRSDSGKPFDVNIQNNVIRRDLVKSGVEPFSSHSFRKALVLPEDTERALVATQRRLGHKSATTTSQYYLKTQSAAGEGLSAVDPTLTKGTQPNDPQSQGRVQSDQPQGQVPQPNVPQQSGSTEAPPPSGVFQAPQAVTPPPGTKLFSGVPLDLERYNELVDNIKRLLVQARTDPSKANEAFTRIHELQTETEAIKNRNKGLPPTLPEDMRPAVQTNKGLLVGERGDTHADILTRNNIPPDSIPHEDPRRGFVDLKQPDKLIDRTSAEQKTGLQGTAQVGGLDSMDLPGGDRSEETPGGSSRLYSGVPIPDFENLARGVKETLKGFRLGTKLPSQEVDPQFMSRTLDERRASLKQLKPTPFDKPALEQRPIGTRASEVGYVEDVTRRLHNAAQTITHTASKALKAIMPIDATLDLMEKGGRTYDGWLFQNVRWPLDVQFNKSLIRQDNYLNPVADMIKERKMDKADGEILGVYAATRQQGGMERLKEMGYTEADVQQALAKVTPAHKEVYAAMRKQMDTSLPEVKRVAKQVFDRDVKAVENYFPFQRDWGKYEAPPEELLGPQGEGEASPGIVAWKEFERDYHLTQSTKTEQGFTESRVPKAKTPIRINAFDIYFRHMKDVAHFVDMSEALQQAGKLVRSKDFTEKFGRASQDMTMDWLNSYATQGRSTKRVMAVDWLRRNTTTGIIAYRVASQFVHLANVPYAMQRAGVKMWARGMDETLRGPEAMGFLQDHFRETFKRGGGEISEEVTGKMRSKGFWIQQQLDRLNAQATVLGVYMTELQKKGLNPNDYAKLSFDEVAGAKARVAARRAVASPLFKDIPLFTVRGGSYARLLTQFQQTFLDQFSNMAYDMTGTVVDAISDVMAGKDASAKAKYAATVGVATLGMLLIESGIKWGASQATNVATGFTPRKEEAFWHRVMRESLRRIPGYSQASANIEYDETGLPAVDVAKNAFKRGKEVATMPEGRSKSLAAVDLATSVGELAGVPGASQAGEVTSKFIRGRLQRRVETDINRVGGEMFPGQKSYGLRERVSIADRLRREEEPQGIKAREAEEIGAAKAQAARRQDIIAALPEDQQAWMKQNALIPEGFRNTIQLGGESIRLTRAEQDFHQKAVTEELQKLIPMLQQRKIEKMPPQLRQRVWSELQNVAHERAEVRTEQFIQAGSKLEPDKNKKRFSLFE